MSGAREHHVAPEGNNEDDYEELYDVSQDSGAQSQPQPCNCQQLGCQRCFQQQQQQLLNIMQSPFASALFQNLQHLQLNNVDIATPQRPGVTPSTAEIVEPQQNVAGTNYSAPATNTLVQQPPLNGSTKAPPAAIKRPLTANAMAAQQRKEFLHEQSNQQLLNYPKQIGFPPQSSNVGQNSDVAHPPPPPYTPTPPALPENIANAMRQPETSHQGLISAQPHHMTNPQSAVAQPSQPQTWPNANASNMYQPTVPVMLPTNSNTAFAMPTNMTQQLSVAGAFTPYYHPSLLVAPANASAYANMPTQQQNFASRLQESQQLNFGQNFQGFGMGMQQQQFVQRNPGDPLAAAIGDPDIRETITEFLMRRAIGEPKQAKHSSNRYGDDDEDDEEQEEEEEEYVAPSRKSIAKDHAAASTRASLFKSPQGPLQQLVVLLLGETGAGKSTFINAVGNYIRFSNIDEALSGQLVSYIPSQFFVTDNNYERRCIKVGESDNECFQTAASATQDPRVYKFNTDKYEVFLIDTPGIGDCRGIEQDKKNMANILSTIASYDTISAVCILMPSNAARLTANISYCLSELHMRLHRDAVKNICFLFTNSRGTFYRPGDSLTTLNEFLRRLDTNHGVNITTAQENMFCFDNEAYRLVCAAHQGVQFKEEQKRDFASSWDYSSNELKRFLDYAATRKPHEVQKTLSLNEARKVILQIVKPVADITQLAEDNIQLASRHKQEVENTKTELKELEKKLKIPHESFRIIELPHPMTVCTAGKCTETGSISNSDRKQVIYKTVCHDHCYLKGVEREILPNPKLQDCAAMNPNKMCRMCDCDWSLHMHIYHKHEKTIMMVNDPNTAASIQRGENAVQVKQNLIKEIEQRIQELRNEQNTIRRVSAKFARFLKRSAIIPYNDIFEEHAKRVIEEEKRIVAAGGDRSTLDGLEESLRLYREERRTINEALDNSSSGDDITGMSWSDIMGSVEELFNLKHTGKQLKGLFDQMEKGDKNATAGRVVKMEVSYARSPPPIPPKPSKLSQKQTRRRAPVDTNLPTRGAVRHSHDEVTRRPGTVAKIRNLFGM